MSAVRTGQAELGVVLTLPGASLLALFYTMLYGFFITMRAAQLYNPIGAPHSGHNLARQTEVIIVSPEDQATIKGF